MSDDWKSIPVELLQTTSTRKRKRPDVFTVTSFLESTGKKATATKKTATPEPKKKKQKFEHTKSSTKKNKKQNSAASTTKKIHNRNAKKSATIRASSTGKSKQKIKLKKTPSKKAKTEFIFNWNKELGEIDTSDAKSVVQNSEHLPNICILLKSLRSSLNLKKMKYSLDDLESAFVYIENNQLIDELMTRVLVKPAELKLITPGVGHPSSTWVSMLKAHINSLFEYRDETKKRIDQIEANNNDSGDDDVSLPKFSMTSKVAANQQSLVHLNEDLELMNSIMSFLGNVNPLESAEFLDQEKDIQLALFRVMCEWRLQFLDSMEYMREMEPNDLRLNRLGCDSDMNEYYTIPGFPDDCRMFVVCSVTGAKIDFQNPLPASWRLVGESSQDIENIVNRMKKTRRDADKILCKRLNNLHSLAVDAENRIQKAAERQERQEILQSMPKKRSGRLATAEISRIYKEEEEKENTERRAAEKIAKAEKYKRDKEARIKFEQDECIRIVREKQEENDSKRQRRVVEMSVHEKRVQNSILSMKRNSDAHPSILASLEKEHDSLVNSMVYCICRQGDGCRFMFECDSCKDWFHNDCMKLPEVELSDEAVFLCPECNAPEYIPKLTDPYMKRIRKVNPKPEKAVPKSSSTAKVARPKSKAKKSVSSKTKTATSNKTKATTAIASSNVATNPNVRNTPVANNSPRAIVRPDALPSAAPLTATQMNEIVMTALNIVMSRPTTPEGMQRKTNVLLKLQQQPALLAAVKHAALNLQTSQTVALNQQHIMQPPPQQQQLNYNNQSIIQLPHSHMHGNFTARGVNMIYGQQRPSIPAPTNNTTSSVYNNEVASHSTLETTTKNATDTITATSTQVNSSINP